MSEELVAELRWCVLPTLGNAAADEIERLTKALATAREDALREAAAVADSMSQLWWAEYKDRQGSDHYQGMSDGADYVASAILALIDKEAALTFLAQEGQKWDAT